MGYKCPSSYNPADFFIKTLATAPGYEENSKQSIKRICDHFAVSDYNREVDVVVQYEFHMGRAVKVTMQLLFDVNKLNSFCVYLEQDLQTEEQFVS